MVAQKNSLDLRELLHRAQQARRQRIDRVRRITQLPQSDLTDDDMISLALFQTFIMGEDSCP